MAEPGGIAVSRAVRDLVELRVEYAFVDGGEHQLKNVSRSVQIFHVQLAKAAVAVGTTTRDGAADHAAFRGCRFDRTASMPSRSPSTS